MREGYPAGAIHELFERQAERTPDAPALRFRDRQVSYAELNGRANGVARYLLERGVHPEDFVGLRMPRSLESVVALIGILKAGGAFVYLDPSWPRVRLQEMIADCKPKIILDDAPAVSVETTNPVSGVSLDNAAYLIYTSGSTGKPKCVVEIHRSMTSRLISAPLPDIQPRDICCLNSSHSFGIAASRLFLPLAQGASVVILPEEDVQDVGRFVRALEAGGVTSVFMVPAVLRQIVAMGKDAACRLQRLRAVAVSGGTLTAEIARDFFRLLPESTLVNVYGASEIGTAAAIQVLTAHSDLSRISLGKPVANTRMYLVNGEICVASPHLARSYLNDLSLTAERFIPNPFAPDTGARMYRTGDLGQLSQSGEMEFLGRADHQVKIRGFRVELGEIEAALHAQPEILEAAVVAHQYDGDKRLAGYVVTRPGSGMNAGSVRAQLSARLPAHMVPATIMFLGRLPRTDSGKIDRNALPDPSPDRPGLEGPYEQPHTEIEREIVEIWEEVLRVRPVGILDHFLDLGGDSLRATELAGRLWERFHVRITLTSIFDRPTVAEQAELMNESGVA